MPATKAKKEKSTESTARCDPSKIAIGSVWTRHSSGTVVGKRADRYTLRNEKGFEWDVVGHNIMEAEFAFADQHDSETTESRTSILEALKTHPSTAMTINFNKKADPKFVASELAKGQGGESDRAWNKKVKDLMAGEERTMVGHHAGAFDEHQRLRFFSAAEGPRLVDTRTINWVICGRVKYVVKK